MTSRRLHTLSQDTLHIQYQVILSLPLIFWILSKVFLNQESQILFGDIFSFFIAFGALVGLSLCFYRAKEWGGVKSSLGLSLTFLGLGLSMWFLGQSSLILDSFLPSPLNIYDFFFIFMDPFYLVSIIFLARSLGVIKQISKNFYLLLIPIMIIFLNFQFLNLVNTQTENQSSFVFNFDILFIFGSILVSSLLLTTYLISYKTLGGKFKFGILLIFLGLISQYIGDNLYEIFVEMFYNGSLSDFFFYLSIYLITCGVISITPKALKYEL